MRSILPILLVLLALLTAGCIVYIAWKLSSDKPAAPDAGDESESDQKN